MVNVLTILEQLMIDEETFKINLLSHKPLFYKRLFLFDKIYVSLKIIIAKYFIPY